MRRKRDRAIRGSYKLQFIAPGLNVTEPPQRTKLNLWAPGAPPGPEERNWEPTATGLPCFDCPGPASALAIASWGAAHKPAEFHMPIVKAFANDFVFPRNGSSPLRALRLLPRSIRPLRLGECPSWGLLSPGATWGRPLTEPHPRRRGCWPEEGLLGRSFTRGRDRH
jgi:hypothetical protein